MHKYFAAANCDLKKQVDENKMSRRKHKQRRDLVENKIRSGKQNFQRASRK
jgi:hypothetical protein